jgi:hypothetical protein
VTETVKPGKRPPCATCGQPGFYLCDYPIASRNGAPHRSCGRVLCKLHATPVAGVAHYCPPHDRVSRIPVVMPDERPRVPGFEE